MFRSNLHAFASASFATALAILATSVQAQESPQPPMKSQEQALNLQSEIPVDFETLIIAVDDAGREKAQKILDLYEILTDAPTIEQVREYISDFYIQHNPLLPDGPAPLALSFAATIDKYPTEIDVHKIIVVDDWAFAHVNFRNIFKGNTGDLGLAGVDIYRFGPDGKVIEHWDVLQPVPTVSANPNGMFETLSGKEN